MKLNNRGFAAVELLIAMPVLIVLLIGVLEVARMMLELNTLNKAVRVGARYASTQSDGAGCGPINDHISSIKRMVIYGNEGGSSSQLRNWDLSDVNVNCSGQYVTVTTTYTFLPTFASALPINSTTLTVPMNSSSVMRIF